MCIEEFISIHHDTAPFAKDVQPSGFTSAALPNPQSSPLSLRWAGYVDLGVRRGVCLDGPGDFALAFTMLHEVGNPVNFLREIRQSLKPGAPLRLTEPIQHVSRVEFDRTVSLAQQEGLVVTEHPLIRRSHAVTMIKPPARQ
jgi:hypothetical protein